MTFDTHHPGSPAPRLLDAGDGGLVIELGDTIDDELNARVVALGAAIEALALPGLHEVVPTYRSLLVLFDPLILSGERLCAEVLRLPPPSPAPLSERTIWRIPVCYGGEHGIDLDHVAATHGLTTDEVVNLHCGALYRIHMIGFAPGFAYLGGLPEALRTSRRTDPRPKTPGRSVSIGGGQTAVSSPIEVPSGWHLIGRTPVRSHDPRRAARPFLFSAGDGVRFTPVDGAAYERLCRAAEAGDIVAERETTA
jgi:5-oxoprolinase (ATP-hydrolysing) subunit B